MARNRDGLEFVAKTDKEHPSIIITLILNLGLRCFESLHHKLVANKAIR
jgi:hypothetical protein